MKRSTFFEKVRVFDSDMSNLYGLDKTVIVVHPNKETVDPDEVRLRLDPVGLESTSSLGLRDDLAVGYLRGERHRLAWSGPDGSVTQRLPNDRGFKRITFELITNPLRAVAAELRARGDLPSISPGEADNVVPPHLFDRERVHAMCIENVIAVAERARLDARAAWNALFDLTLENDQVVVAIQSVELAWDAFCSIGSHAPMVYERAWRSVMTTPETLYGRRDRRGDDADLSYEGADTSRSRGGYLAAPEKPGRRLKLYNKADFTIRFEAQLHRGKRCVDNNTLRTIPFETVDAFDAALAPLARRLYSRMLKVQDELDDVSDVALEEVLAASIPPGRRNDRARSLFGCLCASGRFRNTHDSGSNLRLLRTLAANGIVRKERSPGLWIVCRRWRRLLSRRPPLA